MKRKHPPQTPPVCLSRQLCLSFVFLSVSCGSKISSCLSVPFIRMCRAKNKKKSMVSFICGCIHVCFVWHFDSHLQYLPGQRVDDDPEKKTKKRPWKRSSCRRSNSARLVRNASKIHAPVHVCITGWCEYIGMNVCVCVLCRSSLVWGSSFWRKRGKKSRSGSGTRVASLLSATTPNKATVMQVRAAPWTVHVTFVCCNVKTVRLMQLCPTWLSKGNFKHCLCFRSDFSNQNQLLARL